MEHQLLSTMEPCQGWQWKQRKCEKQSQSILSSKQLMAASRRNVARHTWQPLRNIHRQPKDFWHKRQQKGHDASLLVLHLQAKHKTRLPSSNHWHKINGLRFWPTQSRKMTHPKQEKNKKNTKPSTPNSCKLHNGRWLCHTATTHALGGKHHSLTKAFLHRWRLVLSFFI